MFYCVTDWSGNQRAIPVHQHFMRRTCTECFTTWGQFLHTASFSIFFVCFLFFCLFLFFASSCLFVLQCVLNVLLPGGNFCTLTGTPFFGLFLFVWLFGWVFLCVCVVVVFFWGGCFGFLLWLFALQCVLNVSLLECNFCTQVVVVVLFVFCLFVCVLLLFCVGFFLGGSGVTSVLNVLLLEGNFSTPAVLPRFSNVLLHWTISAFFKYIFSLLF